MKKSYNDKQHEGISEILKKMPRIDAPDNFEFNLMTRIENKNFGTLEAGKQTVGLFWKLTPAAAVVASIMILFFVWNDQFTEIENPLMVNPSEIAISEITSLNSLGANDVAVRASKKALPSVENDRVSTDEELYRVVLRSNDVVSNERVALNLSGSHNVDIDTYLNGKVPAIGANNHSRLVGGGETFEFNGFYIREQTDKRMLQEMKSKVDSIQSAKRDSLSHGKILPR